MTVDRYGEVRQALADAVSTVVRCTPYVVEQINEPCAMVSRREFDPRWVFGQSHASYPFTVRVFYGRTASRASQELMDRHCSLTDEASLIAAIQDGDNWPTPAIVDSVQVVRVGEPVEVDVAGVAYLIVEFDVEVIW